MGLREQGDRHGVRDDERVDETGDCERPGEQLRERPLPAVHRITPSGRVVNAEGAKGVTGAGPGAASHTVDGGDLAESPGLEVLERRQHLCLGVHHERAGPRHGLADRLSTDDEDVERRVPALLGTVRGQRHEVSPPEDGTTRVTILSDVCELADTIAVLKAARRQNAQVCWWWWLGMNEGGPSLTNAWIRGTLVPAVAALTPVPVPPKQPPVEADQ